MDTFDARDVHEAYHEYPFVDGCTLPDDQTIGGRIAIYRCLSSQDLVEVAGSEVLSCATSVYAQPTAICGADPSTTPSMRPSFVGRGSPARTIRDPFFARAFVFRAL